MKSYEGLFVFPPEATPDARKGQFEKLEGLIRKCGGSVAQKNEWGRKPLGYTVRKFREGHLVIWEIQLEGGKVGEFRKALELDEDVIKHMLTVKPERKPKPQEKKDQGAPKVHRRFGGGRPYAPAPAPG